MMIIIEYLAISFGGKFGKYLTFCCAKYHLLQRIFKVELISLGYFISNIGELGVLHFPLLYCSYVCSLSL